MTRPMIVGGLGHSAIVRPSSYITQCRYQLTRLLATTAVISKRRCYLSVVSLTPIQLESNVDVVRSAHNSVITQRLVVVSD